MTRTYGKVGYEPKGKELAEGEQRDCSPEFLAQAFAVLEGRWKLSILHNLFGTEGTISPVRRFSELEKSISGISQKMLIQQLRGLERDGVVTRKVHPEVPPKVEYRLTQLGEALRPTLHELVSWANLRKSADQPARPDGADLPI